jgi:hypothetical protein
VQYAEFRDHLEGALREEGLFCNGAGRRVETIDLEHTVRHWKAYVYRATPANAEPFHVSAAIEFNWSPIDAARALTCEEDLLTDLVGRRARLPRTERRWTRVDLSLHATLPYGSTAPIPEPAVFGGWTAGVVEKADAAFTHVEERGRRIVSVLGGHGDLEMKTYSGPDGLVSLGAVSIAGFRMVRVPRVWDSAERRASDGDPRRGLARLARTFTMALNDWTESISALATWIRYAPPPPGARPSEPWFDDESEDDDDGPDTKH